MTEQNRTAADFRPIFVVGTPRAGTTLVSRILANHPGVFALGETHYFEEIWANRDKFGPLETETSIAQASKSLMTVFGRFNQTGGQAVVDHQIQPQFLIKKALANGGGYGGLYQAFVESLDETGGELRYCDDTPKHLFYLETIFQFFPKAALIICVRDPRDFLCSYKNFWRASRDPDRIRALFHPIITSMLWRTSANVVITEPIVQSSDQVMCLRYESLVEQPEKSVKEICRFTGLEFNGRLLSIETHNSSFDQTESDGIFKGSVGQWASCLTFEEIWWTQRINRHMMHRLGYETADLNVSFMKLALILFTTPFALIRALKANSGRRGPLIPYLKRRLNLLRK